MWSLFYRKQLCCLYYIILYNYYNILLIVENGFGRIKDKPESEY